ncbi:hypothetical protein N9D31_03940 [Oligoflexaceae bacterium]|nr:hypothetical protein [Oligoflexaceae bacterium]
MIYLKLLCLLWLTIFCGCRQREEDSGLNNWGTIKIELSDITTDGEYVKVIENIELSGTLFRAFSPLVLDEDDKEAIKKGQVAYNKVFLARANQIKSKLEEKRFSSKIKSSMRRFVQFAEYMLLFNNDPKFGQVFSDEAGQPMEYAKYLEINNSILKYLPAWFSKIYDAGNYLEVRKEVDRQNLSLPKDRQIRLAKYDSATGISGGAGGSVRHILMVPKVETKDGIFSYFYQFTKPTRLPDEMDDEDLSLGIYAMRLSGGKKGSYESYFADTKLSAGKIEFFKSPPFPEACSTCHSSGTPLKLIQSEKKTLSTIDSKELAAINQYMASEFDAPAHHIQHGRLTELPAQNNFPALGFSSSADKPYFEKIWKKSKPKPLEISDSDAKDISSAGRCQDCHDGESRSKLYAPLGQAWSAFTMLGYMPEGGAPPKIRGQLVELLKLDYEEKFKQFILAGETSESP